MPASSLCSQPFSTIEEPKLYTYFPKWKRNGTPNAEHKFIVNVPYEVMKYRETGKSKVQCICLHHHLTKAKILLIFSPPRKDQHTVSYSSWSIGKKSNYSKSHCNIWHFVHVDINSSQVFSFGRILRWSSYCDTSLCPGNFSTHLLKNFREFYVSLDKRKNMVKC